MGLLSFFKKNRIKIIKILITLVVIYYLLCVCFQIASVLFDDVYNTITLTYLIIIIICNLISEFSPYILHNYLLFIFPFLSNYTGRGALYILIGIASIAPELNTFLNYAGYSLIGIGIICIYLNWIIVKNMKVEYQDFEVMKDNYQDFNDDTQKDSLTFPKFNNDYSNTNNTNNNTNDEIKKNIALFKEAENANNINTNNNTNINANNNNSIVGNLPIKNSTTIEMKNLEK